MSVNQWLLFLLIIQVVHFLGTWKLYVKAGKKLGKLQFLVIIEFY